MQEFIASCLPSARSSTTVQAPQSPSAQPSLVPLSPRWSRSQSSTVVIGDTLETSTGAPFSVKRMLSAIRLQETGVASPSTA